MPHGHVRQPGTLEGVYRVGGAADHGFAVEVEGGVEHRAHAGAALELAESQRGTRGSTTGRGSAASRWRREDGSRLTSASRASARVGMASIM